MINYVLLTAFFQDNLGKPVPERLTRLDLNEARDSGAWEWQWHQLDHMQTICTSLQRNNHTNVSSVNFSTDRMLFLTPNQQCHSTEGVD